MTALSVEYLRGNDHKVAMGMVAGVDIMGLYQDYALPILTHLAMSNRYLVEYRRRTIANARGRVLEIGIGSGLNLGLYGGEVASVHGIDP